MSETNLYWQGKEIRVEILYSRAGVAQHIWIRNKNTAILCDAGDGALRGILSNNLDLDELKAIVITHGHFDHVGGLHSLLGFLRMIGRKSPLPIIAPARCQEATSIVNNFINLYQGTIPFTIGLREVNPHEVLRIAGMEITPYPVVHCSSIKDLGILDQIPAFGYRISCRGETVAVSGDTGLCQSLKDLVKGADLAILEATFETSKGKTSESLEKVHLSEDIAKEVGKLAKDFILVHKAKRE